MDGSFLLLPPSGTGTYLRSLTQALVRIEPDLDIALLVPRLRPQNSVGTMTITPPGEVDTGGLPRLDRFQRLSWYLVGVALAARRARPELLHIPHATPPVGSRLPLVLTIHDVIPLILPAYRATQAMRLRVAALRRAAPRARMVLTPSRAAADDIERLLKVPPSRIRVTPEAATADHVPATNAAASRAVASRHGIRGRYVFNVGGLDVRKNLPVLLEAFARALPHLEGPAQLVIAGAPHTNNPAVFPPLEPVVERLGLAERVVLTGFLSDADKLAFYQGAALYVTPSVYEGFGLTALEAMACGVPTIAANRTSLPEVVGDGGLLVEPEPDALATAVVDVLNTPALAAALRARGLARAATFSWDRTATLTLDAYREALNPDRAET